MKKTYICIYNYKMNKYVIYSFSRFYIHNQLNLFIWVKNILEGEINYTIHFCTL